MSQWTEPQPFPTTPAIMDNRSVSGLSLSYDDKREYLNVYCVSNGGLHAFYRSAEDKSFSYDPCPPLKNHRISGTPAVAELRESARRCLVVPCESGGLLCTSTESSRLITTSYGGRTSVSDKVWTAPEHVAKDLGIISAVSVTAVETLTPYYQPKDIQLLAVLIVRGCLHIVEGPYVIKPPQSSYYGSKSENKWEIKTSDKIQHPGEVTGNPELMSQPTSGKYQLDLIVPSAEGGVFHFVRTPSSAGEWHMIGRIIFPQGIPLAACLTCARQKESSYGSIMEFRALIQSGGRLFQARTDNLARRPWSACSLKSILGPGPFQY